MIQLSSGDYWLKLSDYYYDNVHWDNSEQLTMRSWLRKEYGCKLSDRGFLLQFDEEQKATWFRLIWD
jgi:hypothetical protein